MSDSDEKIESFDWGNEEDYLIEKQLRIARDLEKLRIMRMVKTDGYYTTLLKEHINEMDIVNLCASYSADGAGLDDMLSEALKLLLPVIPDDTAHITLAVMEIDPGEEGYQYNPMDPWSRYDYGEYHRLYKEDDEFRYRKIPQHFYDTWNNYEYVTVLGITDACIYFTGDEEIFDPNGPWIFRKDEDDYVFIHKDNAHFIIVIDRRDEDKEEEDKYDEDEYEEDDEEET
jgi:hypothetical protein